ncbi:MAG: extracellular solute-binding protein, partial [Angelakisella sp.]
ESKPAESQSAVAAPSDAAQKKLVVYSPAPEALLTSVIEQFQSETGVEVELIQAATGELLTRIKAESANPLADVMFGGGAESMDAFKEYLEPYISPEAANIPESFKSPEGYWAGVFNSPMVIMYNTNLVTGKDIPAGWADFADSKWKGKIAFPDPAASGSAYTTLAILLAAMENNGDGGWGFIKQYVDTLDGKILGSSGAPPKGVVDGEYCMCITTEEAVKRYQRDGATNIDLVFPKEGTSAIPSAVGIVKGAANPEYAKKFVDLLLTEKVQSRIADFQYRAVRTGVAEPASFVPMAKVKMANFDFVKAANDKQDLVKKWNDVVIGK